MAGESGSSWVLICRTSTVAMYLTQMTIFSTIVNVIVIHCVITVYLHVIVHMFDCYDMIMVLLHECVHTHLCIISADSAMCIYTCKIIL